MLKNGLSVFSDWRFFFSFVTLFTKKIINSINARTLIDSKGLLTPEARGQVNRHEAGTNPSVAGTVRNVGHTKRVLVYFCVERGRFV